MLKNLGDALVNLSHSFYDSYVEANVKARQTMGLTQQVVRRQVMKCCSWCKDLAGIYTYPDIPDNVWARHNNCKCQVTFISKKGGSYKDVWSRKEFQTQKEARQERIKEIEDLAEFKRRNNIDNLKYIEHNKSLSKRSAEELKLIYNADVAASKISSLLGFDGYYATYLKIERNIVGQKTVDGITIKDQAIHFLQRVVGTMVDKIDENGRMIHRSGVEIEDIKDALTKGKIGKTQINEINGDISRTYYTDKCKVSINPETGMLIQCNPAGK